MTILITKPGILTTVQDLGRTGWRRFGINPGGPMDPAAMRIGNILVGNPDSAAALEMHFPAAEVRFEEAAVFSICGADLGAQLEDRPLQPWGCYHAEGGATLRFTEKRLGERCYLAIRGGVDVPEWLGSRSTNLGASIGGYDGRQLRVGDRLETGPAVPSSETGRLPALAPTVLPRYARFPTVRVVPGAEFDGLDEASRESLFSQSFSISNNSNRMGFRLAGRPLSLTDPIELVSGAVCFGTIQLLPDGQLIVLMADQQTAGGYPRVAHVITRDLPLVGQLGAGDKVAFHLIDLPEAQRLAVQWERELSFLRVACKFALG